MSKKARPMGSKPGTSSLRSSDRSRRVRNSIRQPAFDHIDQDVIALRRDHADDEVVALGPPR